MNKRRLIVSVLTVVVVGWMLIMMVYINLPYPVKKSVDVVMEDMGVPMLSDKRLPVECPEIDLVYTWVNGSDPVHTEKRLQRMGKKAVSAASVNRFRDMGGLQYSIRSAQKYAPWVRKIWIVTDDQVPSFLNTEHPGIAVVSHQQIFKRKSDLPSFNSNAIEINLHNLPKEVAQCFIFLNDDMLFMNHVTPSDFWRPELGLVLYQSSWTAPPTQDKLSNSWHRAIKRCNELFNAKWGNTGPRHYASHGPYFFYRPSLSTLAAEFKHDFDQTSARPFRNENDTTLPFMYMHHTLRYYQSYVESTGINYFAKITDHLETTKRYLLKAMEKKPKTACLNDALSNERPNPEVIEWVDKEFFGKIFPEKSQFEK